jgi:acyl-CoA thioesterase YciA
MISTPSQPYLAVKVVMMPRDTNHVGTIFGGVLLSHIDLAGGVGARNELRQAGAGEQVLVTVAMKAVEFHQPVFVGDVVSFWTRVMRVGTTSITVHVAVEAEREGAVVRLTEAEVTYVAFDPTLPIPRPRPIRRTG